MSALTSGLVPGRKIGSGHFGEVHEAHDPVHGLVAAKFMRRAVDETDDAWAARRDGLLREARNLCRATHPNVVQVHHHLEQADGASILFVMEHCPGGSLQASCDRGPATLRIVRDIGTQVAQGLNALHARGMLHRDIKPANILIDRSGVAKLGDFGLVTDNLLLGYASIQGYWDHLAPEVWAGNGTSQKTDVWALGMTLYRLLHGTDWYNESPKPRTAIAHGGFASTLRWLPHIPKKWRSAIRSMMHDDAGSRCPTALRASTLLAGLPIEPEWVCTVSPALVTWGRQEKGRRINVHWRRSTPLEHEWEAWSEPMTTGRRHRLGSSNGKCRPNVAIRDLQSFFDRYY